MDEKEGPKKKRIESSHSFAGKNLNLEKPYSGPYEGKR